MDCQVESQVNGRWQLAPRCIDESPKLHPSPELVSLTHEEEVVNTITHGFGLMLSVIAATWLAQSVSQQSDPLLIVGCLIYAMSLVGVYFASTLSHLFREQRLRRMFRILDQAVIYLLIVGTFTPFALKYLTSGWWWVLLALMWTIALAGFFSKVIMAHRVDAVSVYSYVLLGWIPITAIKPIVTQLPAGALLLILGGGLCYTAGTVFLTLDRRVKYFHAVWHLLVIAGSIFHFAAVMQYVATATA